MKKTTILFLVLAIILSFAGCTTASIDEETTVASTDASTMSAEDVKSANAVLPWIDSVFEQKRSDSFGGLRASIAEQINLRIQEKISETPDEGPAFYSIEYLSHPEGTEGFFQVGIRFDATTINKEILHVIENIDNPESELYIKGYSKSQVEEIIFSVIEDAENVSESFHYDIIECDHGYCCLVIYN